MNAVDWPNFGQFIHNEIVNNTCLGKFYNDGIKNTVETKRNDVKYGYQFWVYEISDVPALTMKGYGVS